MPKKTESRDVELDYSPSSGALGSEQKNFDANAPIEHDGRSETHTTFNPEEGDNYYYWQKMRDWHDNKHRSSQAVRRRFNRIRDTDTWTRNLDLSKQKRRDVFRLVEYFCQPDTGRNSESGSSDETEQSASNGPASSRGETSRGQGNDTVSTASREPETSFNEMGNIPVEAGILAIIAHVAMDHDDPLITPIWLETGNDYPNRESYIDDSYRDICDVCKLTIKDISQAYNALLPEIKQIE